MKRKWVSVAIALILLLAIPLTSCAAVRTIAQEGTSRPLPVYEPGPYPQKAPEPGVAPFDYKVLGAITDRGTSVPGVNSPIAQLTLQNKDNKSGQFNVRIFFYALDKFTADSQKKTLALPSQRFLMDNGEKFTSEQTINLAPGGMQTVNFAVPEIDMFNDYWYWRYEIVPPVKPKDYYRDPVLDKIEAKSRAAAERNKAGQAPIQRAVD